MKKKNDMKYYFAVLAALFAAINAWQVSAYFYNITPVCNNNICVEGETAVWNVKISNSGRSEVEYISIELVDGINHSQFAALSIPFYPLRDDRGDIIAIKPGEKVSANISGKLPKANNGQLLIYYPCFTTTITDSYTIAKENKYESKQCYSQNETMQVIGCLSNKNCNKNEFCSFNRCLKLNCGSCQYVKNNSCADYMCCSTDQCGFDETCRNNTCQNLSCSFSEYILNHTCYALTCSSDEFVLNDTCVKLDCGSSESAFNHTCKKLNCMENEAIVNHACRLLECRESEYFKNHSCAPLVCKYDEGFFNNTCRPLNCRFFQDAVEHACVNNRQVIIKSAFEALAIIAIIAFLILDLRKYLKKHAKIQKEVGDANKKQK